MHNTRLQSGVGTILSSHLKGLSIKSIGYLKVHSEGWTATNSHYHIPQTLSVRYTGSSKSSNNGRGVLLLCTVPTTAVNRV